MPKLLRNLCMSGMQVRALPRVYKQQEYTIPYVALSACVTSFYVVTRISLVVDLIIFPKPPKVSRVSNNK